MTSSAKYIFLGFLAGVVATIFIGIIATKSIQRNQLADDYILLQSQSTYSQTEKQNIDSSNLVNLNTALQEKLESLPGIGPQKASAIISFREKYGFLLSVDELLYVPGISQTLYDDIKNLVIVN